MSMWSHLRSLFAGPKPKARPARAAPKSRLPPAARADLLAQALAAHRAGRSHVRAVLERRLQELRAKVPDPSRDPAAAARLLALHAADGELKNRILMLVGMRELLGGPPPAAKREPIVPAKRGK